jgi:antiviral helicase SLH1
VTPLADFIGKGVGIFHGAIETQDRLLMLGLFAEGTIRVPIVPHDSITSLFEVRTPFIRD